MYVLPVTEEYWLSVNLTTPVGTLALHRSYPTETPKLIAEVGLGVAYSHAECVISKLEVVLNECGIELTSVTKLIVPAGPGSFTGLRIAYATVKAISLVNGTPIYTIDGSEARLLSWLATAPESPREISVASQVALGRFVVATFEQIAGRPELVSERVVALDELGKNMGGALLLGRHHFHS